MNQRLPLPVSTNSASQREGPNRFTFPVQLRFPPLVERQTRYLSPLRREQEVLT